MLLGEKHLRSILPGLLQLKPRLKPAWTQISPLPQMIVSRLELYYSERLPFSIKLWFLLFTLFSVPLFAVTGPGLLSGQGLQVRDSAGETKRIHEENQAKLREMSQAEILEEQKKLLSQLGRQSCLCLVVIRMDLVRIEYCPFPKTLEAIKSVKADLHLKLIVVHFCFAYCKNNFHALGHSNF